MAKVSTNITLEPELKTAAQELFSDLGMDLTTAITLFLKQSVREQGLPFTVTRAIPNIVTVAALDEYETMKNNPDQYKRYSSFNELLAEVMEDA